MLLLVLGNAQKATDHFSYLLNLSTMLQMYTQVGTHYRPMLRNLEIPCHDPYLIILCNATLATCEVFGRALATPRLPVSPLKGWLSNFLSSQKSVYDQSMSYSRQDRTILVYHVKR